MDFTGIRDLITQMQTGARVSTAIGEPVTVGDRIVVPVAEISYGGGGGGGGGADAEKQGEGGGGGGGGGVKIRPLGCWVIGPCDQQWLPAVDVNRALVIFGSVAVLLLLTIRALARHHRHHR